MSSTPPHRSMRYVVVSPVRDEAQHLEHTIRSMLEQTVRPLQWILVNDGSTDETAEIVDRWASAEAWIVAVHRPNRGRREPGSGVMEAFYDGYQRITATDWEYLAKLDGDLGFDGDYFERCFAEFAADARLGIAGGVISQRRNGKLQVETNPRFHVRGATKIYRRACWDDIGGLIRMPGWDTVDEVKANMRGWTTRSFAELPVIQYRCTGAANGAWHNAIKNGLGSFISGYHPLFLLLRAFTSLFERPCLVGSVGLLYGFLLGYIHGVPKIEDKQLINYLRKQQLRRLLRCPSIWK
jgi:biofilm PGA synthesis N-glycosyltransferase PgaC